MKDYIRSYSRIKHHILATILSLETATKVGSVALHVDGQLLGLQLYDIDKSHSKLLHVMIEQLLKNAGLNQSSLDAIAVSAGPGSYTGLRIGVSSAKGICYAMSAKLIAINTLESMAFQVSRYVGDDYILCPMIDARRMEVYCSLFKNNLHILQETEAVIIDHHSFNTYLEQSKVMFFGDGSNKCKDTLLHENALFLQNIIPSAADIGELAERKYNESLFDDVAYFEPLYLSEFRVNKPKSS